MLRSPRVLTCVDVVIFKPPCGDVYGEYGHHPLKWYFKGEGKLLSDHDHHLSETSAIVVNNGPS